MSTIITDAVTALSGNLALLPEGSGVVTIDGLTHPAADGSAGQLMKTNGSGVLSFVDAPSAGLTLIQTITSSGASTADFENAAIFNGTYAKIIFIMSGLDVSANGAEFRLQVSTGGSYQTGSDYSFHLIQCTSASTSFLNGASQTSANIRLLHQIGNDSTESGDITVEFGGPLNGTAFYKMCKIFASCSGTGTDLVNNIVGSGMFHGSAAALDGVRFLPNSGTFSATTRCYGVTK